jgi:RND family efflux transporter MFP subunit
MKTLRKQMTETPGKTSGMESVPIVIECESVAILLKSHAKGQRRELSFTATMKRKGEIMSARQTIFERANRMALLGIYLAVVFVLSACGKTEAPSAKPEIARPVKTLVLGAGDAGSLRSFPGRVQAVEEVEVAFEVAGTLIELPIKEGQQVEKGVLVARLDPRDFENTVAKEKARRDNAKVNLDRAERLLSSGSISQSEYDNRKTAFEMTDAELKIAQKAFEDTSLNAPFSGLVAKKYVENHQYVQPRQKIASIQRVDHLEILFDIPEDLVPRAKSGDVERLTARFEAAPGDDFDLTIKEYGTKANEQTQTFPVKATMPSPKVGSLLPGMTATVTLKLKQAGAAEGGGFRIPETAVFGDVVGGEPSVWVVDLQSMMAKQRKVKTGDLTGGSILVLDGLKSGETIIMTGVDRIREGMKVEPLKDKRGGAQ